SLTSVTNGLKGYPAINQFDFRTSAVANAPASRQVAPGLEPVVPLSPSLLGAGLADKPAAPLSSPAPPAAPQAGAGIVPLASATVPASHMPATDAVFAAAGGPANDDAAGLFAPLISNSLDAM